jgi:hypothetical protein
LPCLVARDEGVVGVQIASYCFERCCSGLANSLDERNSSFVSLYDSSSVKAKVLPLSALTITALNSFSLKYDSFFL